MDWERDGITRRAALTRGFGGIALVCSFDFDKVTRTNGKKTSAFTRQSASGPFEPFQRDLPIPPVARPVGTGADGAQQYAFTMKAGKAEILPEPRDAGARLQRAVPGADDPRQARQADRGPPDQRVRARR